MATVTNSPDTLRKANLTLIGERTLNSDPSPAAPSSTAGASATTPPTTSAAAPSTPSRAGFPAQILAVMSAIAMILAVRVMTLLAAIGAFLLAFAAVHEPTVMTIAVTLVYDIGVLMPLVWLATKKG